MSARELAGLLALGISDDFAIEPERDDRHPQNNPQLEKPST
jgi:hypothetical protein